MTKINEPARLSFVYVSLAERLKRVDQRVLGDRPVAVDAAPSRRYLAVAIVLSLAAIALNFTPWVDRPWSFAVVLVLVGPLVGIGVNAWLRRRPN